MTKALLPKTLLTSVATLMMAATPVAAQVDNANYDDWSTDGEAGISQDEFGTGFGDNVDLFATWDEDSDGVLSEEEFDAGYNNLDLSNASFGDDFDWTYDGVDADGNGEVNETELHESVFNAYDADANNIIEEPEFGDVGDDIGDGGFWDV